MSSIPEPGLQVAFALLDAVSAFESGKPDGVNEAAMNMALARVDEVEDAVKAEFDPDTDHLSLDLSNVLGGAMVTINWAVRLLAQERGVDPLVVVAEVRQRLEEG